MVTFLKKDLLRLIEQIEDIKLLFHIQSGVAIPTLNIINDKSEFLNWKAGIEFELQKIYSKTKDKYIWGTLVIINQGFNSYNDEKVFNELNGRLLAIKSNIDIYYPDECNITIQANEVKADMQTKNPKVFISHNSKDSEYVKLLVNLLEDIGINNREMLFCTSVSGYGIEFGKPIWEGIEEQFRLYDLYVIFVLSDNFYDSSASLNEMGAAWISKTNYISILLPGFNFKQIEGAIDPTKISLKLDEEKSIVKSRLRQLKEQLEGKFNLPPIESDRWEQKRDDFISAVLNVSTSQLHNTTTLSEGALELLRVAAYEGLNSRIFVIKNLDGTTIRVDDTHDTHYSNKKIVFSSSKQLEIKIWEDYINELLKNKLIDSEIDIEGCKSFYVTQKGLQYVNNHKK